MMGWAEVTQRCDDRVNWERKRKVNAGGGGRDKTRARLRGGRVA